MALNTTSNWSKLVTNGKINNVSINQSDSDTIWAKGSPSLEDFVNSWNSNDGYTNIDANTIKTSSIDITELAGEHSDLYFILSDYSVYGNVVGYFLSISHEEVDNCLVSVCSSVYGTEIGHNEAGINDPFGLCPIIKLPTSIVNQ